MCSQISTLSKALPGPISVIIADDHAMMSDGIASVLGAHTPSPQPGVALRVGRPVRARRPGVTARLGRRRHHLAQGADGGSAAGPEGIDMAGTARTVPPRGGARPAE